METRKQLEDAIAWAIDVLDARRKLAFAIHDRRPLDRYKSTANMVDRLQDWGEMVYLLEEMLLAMESRPDTNLSQTILMSPRKVIDKWLADMDSAELALMNNLPEGAWGDGISSHPAFISSLIIRTRLLIRTSLRLESGEQANQQEK